VECGAPSGKRQRCEAHHARRTAELATARQRRRRAELKSTQRSTSSVETTEVKEATDALAIELAALWAHPELPEIDLYRPVLRSAAKLLGTLKDSGKKVDL
jgi:sRNA-binding protein